MIDFEKATEVFLICMNLSDNTTKTAGVALPFSANLLQPF
jgi:hypothetical protein